MLNRAVKGKVNSENKNPNLKIAKQLYNFGHTKRKRQSQTTSTKPHTIASIHRLIRTMYYLITHNKIYDYNLATSQ